MAAAAADAKDDVMASLNANNTESTSSRPSTADWRNTPATSDESGKAPASSRAGSEQILQPFGSK